MMDLNKKLDTSSIKKKRFQPKLQDFLTKRSTDAHAESLSKHHQGDVAYTHVNDFDGERGVGSHFIDISSSSSANVNVHVIMDNTTNIANQESQRKRRRWRNQWTLLHPWAYLCKSVLNEERIKCSYCEEAKKLNPYSQNGSSSIMISALHDHASSADHRDVERVLKAKKRIDAEGKGSLDHGIDAMNHSEQRRIVTCMKVVYFCALQDIPLEKYPHQCKLLCELDTPNVPSSQEYGAYMNSVSGREMLLSIKDHTKKMVMSEIRSSPFFSLLIDESTDRSIKKHLIVYVLYLTDAGKGSPKSAFVELLPMESGNAKDIFETLCKFIEENFLELEKLIAIATDGASVMTGHKTGVVSRFQEILPRIMGVHCIAHRQALVAKDGFIDHPHVYAFVDKVANKVYSWLGKSSKRHAELWKIMTEYHIMDIKALQIHGVRWLSRGRVMQRLVSIMPAILEQWSCQEKKWYKYATIYVVQFMIHFLADVLMELNKLDLEFQKQKIDITTIGALIDFTFEKLTRRYLCSHILDFAISSPHLSSFLKMTTENMLAYEDLDGKVHTHVLRIEPVPIQKKKNKRKEMSESEDEEECSMIDLNALPSSDAKESGSLEECISMAQTCVNNILNALNKRFEDIPIFNAFKVFSPSSYPSNAVESEKITLEWLERLINRLNVDSQTIDIRRCINEREDFVGMLYRIAKNKSMHDAWEFCRSNKSWWNMFLEMMKLWQLSLVIPASTAACERGFSCQNFIKNTSRCSLGLETLDALMFLSIDGRESSSIDWIGVFDLWMSSKKRRAMPLE